MKAKEMNIVICFCEVVSVSTGFRFFLPKSGQISYPKNALFSKFQETKSATNDSSVGLEVTLPPPKSVTPYIEMVILNEIIVVIVVLHQ